MLVTTDLRAPLLSSSAGVAGDGSSGSEAPIKMCMYADMSGKVRGREAGLRRGIAGGGEDRLQLGVGGFLPSEQAVLYAGRGREVAMRGTLDWFSVERGRMGVCEHIFGFVGAPP